MRKDAALIFGRLLSQIGSFLTGGALLLHLVDAGREAEIPVNTLAMAAGAFFATKVVIPRSAGRSTRGVMILTSLAGAAVTLSAAAAGFLLTPDYPRAAFALLGFLFSAIAVTDTASAQASLGGLSGGSRRLHLDSSIVTFCRLLAPGLAAALLAAARGRVAIVFLIDGLSYLAALAIFLFLLPEGVRTEDPAPGGRSILKTMAQEPLFWGTVVLVALGASAYNGGAAVHLKRTGLGMKEISLFMIAQNAAMMATSVALVGRPTLVRHKVPAAFLAAAGLGLISQADSLLPLSAATALMAAGMVTLIQGFRASQACGDAPASEKRFRLATLATINSVANMGGILIFTTLSAERPWSSLLLAGALVLLLPGFAGLVKGALSARAVRPGFGLGV